MDWMYLVVRINPQQAVAGQSVSVKSNLSDVCCGEHSFYGQSEDIMH